MPGRAYLFALDAAQAAALRACRSPEERERWVASLLAAWDRRHLAEVDKAWPALRRCFGLAAGAAPALRPLLGGEPLDAAAGRQLVLVDAPAVAPVAAALEALDEASLREAFFGSLGERGLDDDSAELDFLYTWQWFQQVRALHRAAALAGRAVLIAAREDPRAIAPAPGRPLAGGGPDRMSA